MFIRSRESIAYDPQSNGKLKTIAPNRVLEMPDELAAALIKAYPDVVFEVEARDYFETATAGPQRKRRT